MGGRGGLEAVMKEWGKGGWKGEKGREEEGSETNERERRIEAGG